MSYSVLFIFVIALLLLDFYFIRGLSIIQTPTLLRYLNIGITLAFYIYILYIVVLSINKSTRLIPFFVALLALLYIPKLLVFITLFLEDVFRLGVYVFKKSNNETPAWPDRKKAIGQLALLLASIPFLGILHGIFFGKYRFRVIRKCIFFDELPDTFDGFTITQISDLHSGSFDNYDKISYGVSLIQAQKSDLFVFTGDLVNVVAKEIDPWVDLFKQIKAPYGKYAVLGNHDYGDYTQWNNPQEKEANMQHMYNQHKKLGFNLLRNESAKIKKDHAHINLCGVENWGEKFMQKGDLAKAMQNIPNNEDEFSILLSHDPTHFDKKVKHYAKKVHLTLSGHTHGMQFGIEIPGFRWSPSKWIYPKWAGLYKDLGRYLYVNRGFGFLAFPGRVGIWPEITVITLKKTPCM